VYLFADLLIEYGLLLMVGAEGIEPSTSSASRKHSSTELRAYSLKPIYIKYLDSMCQHSRVFSKHPYFLDNLFGSQASWFVNAQIFPIGALEGKQLWIDLSLRTFSWSVVFSLLKGRAKVFEFSARQAFVSDVFLLPFSFRLSDSSNH
jgi:hypothetical protein